MSDHDKAISNLSNRMSIYRGHHEEKEKRYLATYNCFIEKQRQETLQLQQQVLNKESKKKSNKTGPRPNSRSVKKTGANSISLQQQQQHTLFNPEKIKQEQQEETNITTLSQSYNPNGNISSTSNNFATGQYPQPIGSRSQKQPIIHQNQQQNQPLQLHQYQQAHSQLIQDQPNLQHYHQFQNPDNFHNNYHHQQQHSQQHPQQQSISNSQYNQPTQAQTHQFQTHPNNYNTNHQYVQIQHPQQHSQHHLHTPHLHQLQLPNQDHHQQLLHQNARLQYQKPIAQENHHQQQQDFQELKDEDLACLDNFHNSVELPLTGFAPINEQEIFLDPNFIEKFLDNI